LLAETASLAVDEEFRVQLELFEGPLDLLLFLIRRAELEISELALAQITSQYLAYLELFQTLSISLAGDYLFHAATLVELKSGRLVPRPPLDLEQDAESPSEELVRRLREHAEFRAVSERLAAVQEAALRRWFRDAPAFAAPSDIQIRTSLTELCYSLDELLRSIRRGEAHQVRLDEWSVPEKMQQLALALERDRRVSLTWLLDGCTALGEKVALLLAALELTRALRPVHLAQLAPFADIELVLEES
jgi:segregation and condensation protein A